MAGAGSAGAYPPGAGARPAAGTTRAPARRGTKASVALALVAVVLFAVAGGGGFALARLVSGQQLLPPAGSPAGGGNPPTVTPPPSPPKLVPQKGDASDTANATPDSLYTVSVPDGWKRFAAGRTSQQLGPSMVVQYVSPDGRQSLRLERYPGFYKSHSTDDYLTNLQTTYSPDTYTVAQPPTPTDDGVELTYRNVEHAPAKAKDQTGAITRATFTSLRQVDANLWVLSLTVPSEQEDTAAATFHQILPTLSFTGS